MGSTRFINSYSLNFTRQGIHPEMVVTLAAPGKEIFMKILVGYNGSEVAKSALSQAKSYAITYDAFVHVVTSFEGGTGEKIEEISAASENLKFAQDFLERDGVRCKTEQLVRGLTPGEDLVQFDGIVRLL